MNPNQSHSYINYLKLEQPELWLSILRAQKMGLIYVDEENDAVTATNRLLLTYPDLHEVLNMLSDSWMQQKGLEIGKETIHNLINNS